MNTTLYFTILATIVYIGVALCTVVALADTTVTNTVAPVEAWTSSQWFTRSHPKPAEFIVTNTGEMHGITVDGVPFSQIPILTPTGIRVQQFTMQQHRHYIIEGVPVYNLTELSIRLANLGASHGQS